MNVSALRRVFGRGLRARVVWSTAGLTALGMAAMIGAVAIILGHFSTSTVDAELSARIDAAIAGLHVDPRGGIELNPNQTSDPDDRVWVFDSSGELIAGPLPNARDQDDLGALRHTSQQQFAEQHGRRFLAQPVRIGGPNGPAAVLVTTENLAPYEATRTAALLALLGLSVIVVAGTAGLSAWTVGRTLRPVRRMTALAADWSERDLETRFDLTGGGDELTELGNTLDSLLDRVATALRDEQRLTAELAHELRTPLTAIRGEAELGQLAHPSDPRYARIVELANRLSTTITALLSVARERSGSTRRADLGRVLADLVAALPVSDIEVVLDVPTGNHLVAASPEVVERAVAPVLDNAIRYASARVTVDVVESARTIGVTVADDGPGLAEEDRESIFVAGARRAHVDGVGLGLPLSRRVAQSAGGDVAVVSASKPTMFEIRLPRR